MPVLKYVITPTALAGKVMYELNLREVNRKWWESLFTSPINKYIGLFKSIEEAEEFVKSINEGTKEIPYVGKRYRE